MPRTSAELKASSEVTELSPAEQRGLARFSSCVSKMKKLSSAGTDQCRFLLQAFSSQLKIQVQQHECVLPASVGSPGEAHWDRTFVKARKSSEALLCLAFQSVGFDGTI